MQKTGEPPKSIRDLAKCSAHNFTNPNLNNMAFSQFKSSVMQGPNVRSSKFSSKKPVHTDLSKYSRS